DNCEDEALQTALSILQKRFRSLKSEIYRADEQPPSSTDLFRFLSITHSDSSVGILRRYAKESTPKHRKQTPMRDRDRHQWRELEVSSSRENLPAPVPPDVPPFSVPAESPRATVKDRTDATHHMESNERVHAPLRIVSDEPIPSSELSSITTSDDDASELGRPNADKTAGLLQQAAQRVQDTAAQRSPSAPSVRATTKVDRAVGPSPRSYSSPTLVDANVQTQPIYTLEDTFRTSKLRERPVSTSSVAVQADVPTSTKTVAVETTPSTVASDGRAPASSVSSDHAHDVTPVSRPAAASTPTGNSSQSGTTSSSLLSSELSAGQISFHRAAIMVARSHYTSVVSVRQDGSLYRLPESFRPSAATRLDQTPTSSKPRGTHREFIRFSEERLMRTSDPIPGGNANLSGFDERLARQSPFSSTPLYPPRNRTQQLRHPPDHGTNAVGPAVASTPSHPPQRSGPCVREWEDESDWMGNASTEGTGTMPALLAREVSIRTTNDSFDADR
ncbi:hypothetical protein AAVH_33468, partial [Aphelenchoides avenae]